MKLSKKSRASIEPFRTGQVWKLVGSQLHISLVGKRLVHYKHFQGETKRAPVSLATKLGLESYLLKEKAVLIQG